MNAVVVLTAFCPAAFGRLCVETVTVNGLPDGAEPAAFGRLCVETSSRVLVLQPYGIQPPSGGCVLKLHFQHKPRYTAHQPPSGGCVLKLIAFAEHNHAIVQPPSGGCVLKLSVEWAHRETA